MMRWSLLFSVLTALRGISAEPAFGSTSLVPGAPPISQCALQCLLQVAPLTGCGFGNATCTCNTPKDIQRTTVLCLYANCTMAETLDIARIQAVLCNKPHDSQQTKILVIGYLLFALAFSCMLIRIGSKLYMKITLGIDDWLIVVVEILVIPSVVFHGLMINAGYGLHAWDLDYDGPSTIFKYLYLQEIIYFIVMNVTKIAFCFFLIRIFPQRWFRITVHTIIFLTIVATTVMTFRTIFQCDPVQATWDRDIKGSHCSNREVGAYAYGAINIVQDIFILVIPIHPLMKLKIRKHQRISLAIIFFLGGSVCIFSIARQTTLVTIGSYLDPSYELVNFTILSTFEMAMGVIVATAPAFRAIYLRFNEYRRSRASSSEGSSGWNSFGKREKKSGGKGKSFNFNSTATEASTIDVEKQMPIVGSERPPRALEEQPPLPRPPQAAARHKWSLFSRMSKRFSLPIPRDGIVVTHEFHMLQDMPTSPNSAVTRMSEQPNSPSLATPINSSHTHSGSIEPRSPVSPRSVMSPHPTPRYMFKRGSWFDFGGGAGLPNRVKSGR